MAMKKQIKEEEEPGGAYDEANDHEFAPMPHLADGDIIMPPLDTDGAGFDVDGGDSDTKKALPLSPEALPQLPKVQATPIQAPPQPVAQPPVAAAPHAPMPGMPATVTPDDLKMYLDAQRSALQKYSPDKQYNNEMASINARRGFGSSLAMGGATMADAIMQGVARAGNPGFARQQMDKQNELANEQASAFERARKGTMEQQEAGQKIDAQDPGSAMSQAYQKAFSPIFAKMGYDPKSVAGMPASQINTVADLGVRYADAQTQLDLKKAMLQVQTLTAEANMANQRAERSEKDKEIKKGAAEEVGKHYLTHPINAYRANQTLADIAQGKDPAGTPAPTGPLGPETTRGGKTYEWSPSTGKYHLKS